jgi:hypothetical protein
LRARARLRDASASFADVRTTIQDARMAADASQFADVAGRQLWALKIVLGGGARERRSAGSGVRGEAKAG